MPTSELTADHEQSGSAADYSGRISSRTGAARSHSFGWVVLAGFIHRTSSVPVGIALGIQILGQNAVLTMEVGAVVAAANTVLVIAAAKGWLERVLPSRKFFAVDVGLALGLNCWATTLIPDGEFLTQGADVFHLYGLGTIVAWTSLRGYRAAALIIGSMATIDIGSAIMTHSPFTPSGILQLLSRVGWLSAGMVVPLVILFFARRATALADERARAAGAAVERAHALRSLHDTVLQTFGHIVRRCAMREQNVESQFYDISRIARERAMQLQELLVSDDSRSTGSLTDRLRDLSHEFQQHQLATEFFTQGQIGPLAISSTRALIGATREALTNVVKYAQTEIVRIDVIYHPDSVEVLVTDKGCGFDPARQGRGYGIEYSIMERLRDVDGSAKVISSPGNGTTIQMAVPRRADMPWFEGDINPSVSIALGDNQKVSAEEITSQALNWFAIPAMAYRICISPLQAIIALATVDIGLSTSFAYAMAAVLTADIVILVGLIEGRFRRLLLSNVYLAADVLVAVALNVWASAELPPSTILLPGREVFWGYALGVLAFWTGLRGAMTGVVMVICGVPLQVTMVLVNGASLNPPGLTQVLAQEGLLVMTLVVVWMMTVLARSGARKAVAEGVREGRAIERTHEWRSLYMGVLSVLDLIVERSADTRRPVTDRLQEIRGLALAESDRLRAMLGERRGGMTNLGTELNAIREEFRRTGLRVELVTAELDNEPPPAMGHALTNALREALYNAWRHANVVHVVVNAATHEDGTVEITIRDHGRGFDPDSIPPQSGIARTIIDGMRQAGGSAVVWSAPGSGTRVRLLL